VTLCELQRALVACFRGGISVEATAGALGLDPARLAIYARMVEGHVRQAVTAMFPETLSALDPTLRPALDAAFYAAHPPSTWSLDAAAVPFSGFLEGYLPSRVPEPHAMFLVELARFEAVLAEVAHDTTIEVAGAEAATDGPFRLNPTLIAVDLEHPIVEWLVAAPRAGVPPPRGPGHTVLIFRHPVRDTACYQAATDDLLFALKIAAEGLEPEHAARTAGLDPGAARAAMTVAVALGLVTPGRGAAGA